MQHVAKHCNTLPNTATHCNTHTDSRRTGTKPSSTHWNTLQHTATHCNTLPNTATRCQTHTDLRRTGTKPWSTLWNTLQHTATHCNTLQHTATHCNALQHTATHCNTLQHTATHCSTLQHTATQTHGGRARSLDRAILVPQHMCPKSIWEKRPTYVKNDLHMWKETYICEKETYRCEKRPPYVWKETTYVKRNIYVRKKKAHICPKSMDMNESCLRQEWIIVVRNIWTWMRHVSDRNESLRTYGRFTCVKCICVYIYMYIYTHKYICEKRPIYVKSDLQVI